MHEMGLLFASLPAPLGADGLRRRKTRRGVKPSGQNWTTGKRGCLARQGREHLLRDILGEMRVPAHPPERAGVDKIEVSLHQLGKRRLGISLGIAAEQFGVVDHGGCPTISSRRPENRTKNRSASKLPGLGTLPAATARKPTAVSTSATGRMSRASSSRIRRRYLPDYGAFGFWYRHPPVYPERAGSGFQECAGLRIIKITWVVSRALHQQEVGESL